MAIFRSRSDLAISTAIYYNWAGSSAVCSRHEPHLSGWTLDLMRWFRPAASLALWSFLLLVVSGCLRPLETSPLLPTETRAVVAVNASPTASTATSARGTEAATTGPTNEATPTWTVITVPGTETATVTVKTKPATATATSTTQSSPQLVQTTETATTQAPPPTATRTRTATPSSTAPRTSTPTEAPSITPSATATRTARPSATPTATDTPTETAMPSDTATEAPSITPSATPTQTARPSATSTATGTPTPTETVTATEISTFRAPGITAVPTVPPPTDGARGTIDADCNYRVAVSDRLFRIALRFNRTIRELSEANHLADATLIRPGQILKIPDCFSR